MGEVGFEPTHHEETDLQSAAAHRLCSSPQKTKTQVLYVPGHYYAMAVAFKLFGYHPWAELIPSLLGFILLVCGVYLIAENLFGKDSALGSAVIVLFFPYLLLFSLTSMAELPVLASAVTAFVFCLWVPRSWVSILGPVFILFAVCFRETSILIVLPLLGVLWNRIDSSKKWQNIIFIFKYLPSSIKSNLF